MASLENSGSPVRVNGLQVTVGPHDHHVRKEKNIELGQKWEGDFGVNWETNDDGDLEMVEMKKDFSVESSTVEDQAVKTPALKSWVLESPVLESYHSAILNGGQFLI